MRVFRLAFASVALAEALLGAVLSGTIQDYLWATAAVTLAFGLVAARLLDRPPPPPPPPRDPGDDPPEPDPNPPWWPAFEADLYRYEQERSQTLTSRR